ncbi:MAG: PEGA domain-containing protein, partial [Caldilineaceae bacterium]|nr:PEGA domain-containing protein [Caldilineaceae bacterium]
SLGVLFITGAASAVPLTDAQLRAQMITEFNAKRYDQALAHAQELYRRTRKPILLLNIGRCYDLLKRHELALQHYERHLKLVPSSNLRAGVEKLIADVRTALRLSKREVRFVVSPVGAEVEIDGTRRFKAPAVRWLSFGFHRIAIHKPGHHTLKSSMVITQGPLMSLAFTLEREVFGQLSVTSSVRGAKVYLDDKLVGVTPITGKPWPTGTFKLKVVGPKHRAWETSVTIKSEQHVRLVAQLTPMRAPSRGMSSYRIAAWTTLGIGVGALAGGLALQLLAKKKSQEADELLQKTPVEQQDGAFGRKYDSLHDQAVLRRNIAIGLYVGGGALVATSIVLFFIKPKRKEGLSWMVSPTRNGMSAMVRF